ncbi:MAG: hypothetical protein ACRDZ4_18745 [Egibacteraceae bacterium]
MTTDKRSLLGHWLARLTLDPLDPTDPGEDRYVELQAAGRGAIDTIFSHIGLALEPTTQLVSGPAGSGKTTELYRLRGKLENAGFTVALVNILDYVNPSYPIDATEFLIALGLAVGAQLPNAPADEQGGFASRLRNLLSRTKASIRPDEIDLERELKSSEPFVRELRRTLALSLGDLSDEVASFLQRLVRENKARHPDSRGVVMIVDGLESVRGTTVQRLFTYHSDKLRFRSHHMVYAVTASLMLAAPGSLPHDGPVRSIPIPQVRDRAGRQVDETVAKMVEVVARRCPWDRLLEDKPLLEDVVLASGGHLGDLMRILQEVITLAHAEGIELPVGREHVAEVLTTVTRGFSIITRDEAELLRRVNRQGGTIEPSVDETPLLARLVDTHLLLAHRNDDDWYEVHPLARRILGLV